MGLVGLMQTLGIEGAKHDIRVNCLAPTGATRMMEGILPPDQLAQFKPELVSPAVLALVAENAPNRAILSAGAGGFELAYVALTQGIHLGQAVQRLSSSSYSNIGKSTTHSGSQALPLT